MRRSVAAHLSSSSLALSPPGEVHAGDVFERFTSSQHQRILGVVQCLAQRYVRAWTGANAFMAVSNRWASI